MLSQHWHHLLRCFTGLTSPPLTAFHTPNQQSPDARESSASAAVGGGGITLTAKLPEALAAELAALTTGITAG